jgi:glucose/mannose-6-phosphate isomerase
VDEGVLVFSVSYSGDTEETLSMLQEAIDIGAPVVTVTSGGRMAEISEEKGIPMIPLPEGVKPRAALPHQFLSLAVVLHKLNLLGRSWDELGEAFLTLETLRDEIRASVPVESNTAKRTAARLVDKVPLVYGSRLLEGVAYRFGTQLNENSKVPSGSGSFPEVFHNAVVGSEANRGLLSRLAMVIFRDLGDSESVGGKIDRFIELFAPRVGGVIELESRGEGRLSRMMSLIYLGDYISTYLGLLYGIDPSSNRSIDELKRV